MKKCRLFLIAFLATLMSLLLNLAPLDDKKLLQWQPMATLADNDVVQIFCPEEIEGKSVLYKEDELNWQCKPVNWPEMDRISFLNKIELYNFQPITLIKVIDCMGDGDYGPEGARTDFMRAREATLEGTYFFLSDYSLNLSTMNRPQRQCTSRFGYIKSRRWKAKLTLCYFNMFLWICK